MKLFARITKVDVAKREVWGRAVQEVPDKADEIFDYESSKPLFASWSAEFEKATDGKSLGNIRAMHGKVAAGKAIAVDFNDAEKAIDIGAKIVDDAEWKKVEEGVYTGFSIGGSYQKRWADPDTAGLTRYTAAPSEISIVDSPCVPTARFAMVKADGSVEERAFADVPRLAGDARELLEAFAPAFAKMDDAELQAIVSAARALRKTDDAQPAAADSAPVVHAAAADPAPEVVAPAVEPAAEPAADASEPEKAAPAAVKKSIYAVQDLAGVVQSIAWMAMDAESEAAWEGDSSPLPAKLRGWLAVGVQLLQEMTAEETTELLAYASPAKATGSTLRKSDVAMIQSMHDSAVSLGAACGSMKAADSGELAKVAAAKADVDAQLGKLTTERDALQKRVRDLEAQPAAPKGVVRAVSKDDDAGKVEKLDAPKPNTDDPLAVMKAVHAGGGRRITV